MASSVAHLKIRIQSWKNALNSQHRTSIGALHFFIFFVGFTASFTALAHGEPIYDHAERSDPSVRIGGMVVVAPKYEGSKDHDVFGIPLIIPNLSTDEPPSSASRFAKRVSFKGIDDIRFRAFEWNAVELGPVAGYRTGRDESDGRRLGGLGDIDDGLVVGGYIGVRFGQVLLDTSVTTQVTGDDSGVLIRAGAEVTHELTPGIQLRTRVGTTIADDEYAETFFGITATQAGRSTAGLAAYDAGAGIKDVFLDLNTQINLTDRWRLQIGGRYARLVGDAADSPIVETEDQFSGRLGVGYKFDLGSLR